MVLIRGYMNILIRVQARQAQAQLAAARSQLNQLQKAHMGASRGVAMHESRMQSWLRTGTKFGNQLQWTGRQLQYNWTLPLATAGAAAVTWQLNNERAMTRVKKVYGDFDLAKAIGADGVARELGALEKAFEALSNQYGETQEAVTNIGASWAAAGASGLALAKSTELTLKAMVLGEMDATKATTALVSIQSQFHLTTEGLNTVLAELNIIENQTAVSMQDLIEAFTRSAGVARNAGITTRELGAMVAALVPAAGSAANAGNALKTIISRLMAPTNEARQVLKLMGIEIGENGWQSLTATKRLEVLSGAFVKLNQGQKAAVSSAVASRWQLNRFDVLMEALSNTNSYYTKALEATADKTMYLKQAQKELNAVLTSNPQRVKQVWVILQNAATDVIQPLIPYIVMLAQKLAGLAQGFAALDPQIQYTIVGLAVFVAAIGPIAKYLGSFITLIHILASGFAYLTKPLMAVLGLFGLLGKNTGAATGAVKQMGLLTRAGNAFNLTPRLVGAGAALVGFWKKFSLGDQIRGRLMGLMRMIPAIAGLAVMATKHLAQGGDPVRTRNGRFDPKASAAAKQAAQAQMRAYSTALKGGLFAAFAGLGTSMSSLFKNLGKYVILGLRALPGILLRFLVGPFGWALLAVLGVFYTFHDQLSTLFGRIGQSLAGPWNEAIGYLGGTASFFDTFIQFLKNAFWSLPVEVQNAMIAVVTVVQKAALAVYEWFQYLNPFARHSPSLVENVDNGVTRIVRSFGNLNQIEAPIQRAYSQISKLKSFMGGLEAAEQQENISNIAKVSPSAAGSYRGLLGTLNVLKGQMASLEPRVRAQEAVVKRWKAAIDAVTASIEKQNDKLEGLRARADRYSDAIEAAQSRISELASAPLRGMEVMDDAIFANTQQQNRLRLEMLRMQEAGKTYDDVRNKVALLAGDIETLRSTQSELRSGGAGSDILKFYDEEAKKLQKNKDKLEQQKNPYQELENQLDELQRKAEILDLEKALKFDGPLREIEKLASAQKELTFDQIAAGIREARATIATYTPKLNEANAAIAQQERVIARLEAQRKALESTYDRENEKLDALKDAYSELGSAISDVESALNGVSSASERALNAAKAKKKKGEELSPAAKAFLEAGNADFPIQGAKGAKIGREGGNTEQTDLIDQYTKELAARTASMFGSLDIFKPLKDKWNELKNWYFTNIHPAWGPIAEGIAGIFAGIDWLAPFKGAIDFGDTLDWIKDTAVAVWGWLEKVGGILYRLFAPDVKLAAQELGEAFGEAWGDVKEAFGAIDWSSVGTILVYLGKAALLLAKVVGGVLVVAVKLVTSVLARTLGPIIKLIAGLFKGLVKIVSGVIDVIAGLISGDWGKIYQGLEKIRDGITDVLQQTFRHVGEAVLGVLEGLLNVVPDLINAIFDTDLPSVRDLINGITSWFDSLKKKLPESLQKTWNAVVGFFKDLWEVLVGHSIVPDTIDDIVDCFESLPGRLKQWLQKTYNDVKAKFNELKNWVKDTWSKSWAGVKKVMSDPIGAGRTAIGLLLGKTGVRDKFNQLKSWVTDNWKKSWESAKNVLKNPVSAGRDAIATILGKTGLRMKFDDFYTWFRDTWIGKRWSTVAAKMRGPMNEAKQYMSDVLTGKKSIRQVFNDGVNAIGKAWDRLKEKAKDPIKFVVNTVFNKGLIPAWNALAKPLGGPELKELKLPRGFYTGGSTGNVDPKKVAGVVHGNEHVVTAREVAKTPGGHKTWENLRAMALHGALAMPPGFFLGGQVPTRAARIVQHSRAQYPWARWAGDINGPGQDLGQPIVAWKSGIVAAVRSLTTSYGKHIRINHAGQQTLYAHMSRLGVDVGQKVAQGQVIGNLGETGNAFGPHLHFELKGGNGPLGAIGGAVAGVVDDLVAKLKGRFQGPLDRLKEYAGTPIGKMITGFPRKAAGWMYDKAADIMKNLGSGIIDEVKGAVGVTRWTPTVLRALAMTGNSPTNLARTLRRMKQESGGNPKAINNWDINAKNGTPSKGLMQVIDPTFAAYRDRNLPNDIWNPLANIVASMRYAKSRYGSLKSAYDRPGGYARGTLGSRSGYALVGERGPELANLSGGTRIFNNRASSQMIGSEFSAAVSRAFARSMSTAAPTLEAAVVASVRAATRRAERRLGTGSRSTTVASDATAVAKPSVIIEHATLEFPNVKNGSDARAFIDNLITVTTP